jgi:hypothetical protein
MFKIYNLWSPLLLKKPPPLPASLEHFSLSLQVELQVEVMEAMEALVVVEMEMMMVEMEGVEMETEATLLAFLQVQLVRSTLVLRESPICFNTQEVSIFSGLSDCVILKSTDTSARDYCAGLEPDTNSNRNVFRFTPNQVWIY